MKKTPAVIVVALMVMFASGTFAADLKLGVVDLTKLVTESAEGKKAQADLEAFIKSKQAPAEQMKAKIDSLQQEIQKTTDANVKKTKEAGLGKLRSESQSLTAANQAEIQKKATDLRVELMKDVKKAIEAVGAEEKFTVIFTSDYIPYADKTIDITEAVAKKFEQVKAQKQK